MFIPTPCPPAFQSWNISLPPRREKNSNSIRIIRSMKIKLSKPKEKHLYCDLRVCDLCVQYIYFSAIKMECQIMPLDGATFRMCWKARCEVHSNDTAPSPNENSSQSNEWMQPNGRSIFVQSDNGSDAEFTKKNRWNICVIYGVHSRVNCIVRLHRTGNNWPNVFSRISRTTRYRSDCVDIVLESPARKRIESTCPVGSVLSGSDSQNSTALKIFFNDATTRPFAQHQLQGVTWGRDSFEPRRVKFLVEKLFIIISTFDLIFKL